MDWKSANKHCNQFMMFVGDVDGTVDDECFYGA